jgi:hypothetical protein
MEKLHALLDVFRYGGQLADPREWTTRKITASVVAGFLAGCLHVLEWIKPEWKLPITSGQLDLVAGAFVTVVNVALDIAKSADHGILPAKPVADTVRPPDPDAAGHDDAIRDAWPVPVVNKPYSSAARQPDLDRDLYRG